MRFKVESEMPYQKGYGWQKTAEGLAVVEVANNIWGVTFPDADVGFNVNSPNIWIVRGKHAAIVDTGWGEKKEMQGVRTVLRGLGRPKIDVIITTHDHLDHSGGVDELQERTKGKILDTSSGKNIDLGYEVSLKIIPTPGHTPESICVLEGKRNILFTGDTILGSMDTVSVDEEGMRDYMESLHRLQDLHPSLICPGHGPVIDNPDHKLKEMINYRLEREAQIIEQIKMGNETVRSIARALYPQEVWGIAPRQVEAHLFYLIEQGRVSEENGKYLLSS